MIRPPEEIPAAERLIRAVEKGLLPEGITWLALDSQGTSVYRERYLEGLREVYRLRPQCLALASTTREIIEPAIAYFVRQDGGPPERLVAESVPPALSDERDVRWVHPRVVDFPDDHVAHAEIRVHRPDDPPDAPSKRLKSEKLLVMTALAERFAILADDPGRG